MSFYIFNLLILIPLIYRIAIGAKGGLFSECINLVNLLFSAGMSFTLLKPTGAYVQRYLCPEKNYALIIAFWGLFIFFFSILWISKQLFLSKVYTMAKKGTVPFPVFIDRTGGAICGLFLGMVLVSTIIISLYTAPVTRETYQLRKKDKIIFNLDEAFPRAYSAFTKRLVPGGRFDWRRYMRELEYPKEESSEQTESMEQKKEESPE
ncbi:MAG TPA: CvpA family protein [Candidatus Omnitrophica bacterium]|nr:CvpA family protein [Candidatus Omnitrophota bacterium]